MGAYLVGHELSPVPLAEPFPPTPKKGLAATVTEERGEPAQVDGKEAKPLTGRPLRERDAGGGSDVVPTAAPLNATDDSLFPAGVAEPKRQVP